jgi:hypothetical protein
MIPTAPMPIRSVANNEASTRCQARVVVVGVTANQASRITKSPERIIQGRWYQAANAMTTYPASRRSSRARVMCVLMYCPLFDVA